MTDKTLNEGKWLSKIKDLITSKSTPSYSVELTCYPPFKAEPVVWKIDDVYSLDDERIQRAYEHIRRQHPKSLIRLRSPLGNKTFYENSSSEYELKAYDKDSGRVDTFNAGTLPLAMAMCEKMWNANPDAYKTIEVIHNNEVVTSYNGLEEGFTMNLNAAPDPNDDESNKNNNQQDQQQQVPQVDPDTSTVIKDDQGNDVIVSMTPDAEKVTIDGQNIDKEELNKAINDVENKIKDNTNKVNDEQDQRDQEEPEQNDQNTEEDKENSENQNQEEQSQDDDSKETNDQNKEQDTKTEEPASDEDNLDQYDVYDPEYDDMKKELGTKGNAAVDAGMKQFDKQAERDKRDADLEAEREKALERRSYKDNGGQSFANKILNNNVTKNLAAAGLTGLTGGAIAPMFAKHVTDHGIDRINNYNKETERINKAEKDFDQKAEKNKKLDKAEDERLQRRKDLEKKLTKKYSSAVGYRRQDDIEKQAQARAVQAAATKAAKDAYNKKAKTSAQSRAQQYNQKAKETMKNAANRNRKHESINEAELNHAWVNQRKDIADINEFVELAKNGIHPALADTRRPKFHNIFAKNEADRYVEVEGQPLEKMIVLDGVEEIKHPTTGEPVMVAIIKEKIPTGINQETGGVLYKDGERHEITFNQFKRLINDDTNAEILQKFEKSHPDDPEIVLELYTQAKANMDEMYSTWENSYWDEYGLANYTPIERGNIYLRWKEVLKDTAYQDGHEMTADEVNREFGIPKLQEKLKQASSFNSRLDQQAIDNLLKQLPENKVDDLLDQLETTLEDCYNLNLNDIQRRIGEFMLDAPVSLACENLINKLTNDALNKLENNISKENKDDFDADKSALLDRYIKKVNIHGNIRVIVDPSIINHKNEIIKYIDDLRKKYGISKWSMNVNQVMQSTTDNDIKKDINAEKPLYDLPDPNSDETIKVKQELDAFRTNNYQLKSEIDKLEYQFSQGLISKEDVLKRIKELSNPEDNSWENVVNTNIFYNDNDKNKNIGILDRIDRSLARYDDEDANGMPLAAKYRELLNNLISQWKKDYPEGNEEELGNTIKSWYKYILRPDIAKDASVGKQLQNYIVGD